jgi:hypothetical protein
MDCHVTLVKQDNGLYADTFTLVLESGIIGHLDVKINERDYEAIKKKFNLTVEEMQFPAHERERCY